MALTPTETLLLAALKSTTDMLKTFPLQTGFDHIHFCQFCWAPSPENPEGEVTRIHRANCKLDGLVAQVEKVIARVESSLG